MDNAQTKNLKITAFRIVKFILLAVVVIAIAVCIASTKYLNDFVDEAKFKTVTGEVQNIAYNQTDAECEITVNDKTYRIDTWWNKFIKYRELNNAISIGDTVEMLITLDNEIMSIYVGGNYLFTTKQTITAYTEFHDSCFTIVAVVGVISLLGILFCSAKIRKLKESTWSSWFE